MGKLISKQIIEDIRTHNDIVDMISSYIQLKRNGNTFKALCPFHKEKTPSFHVNPARQIFHCFGCGAGGDVFRFLMQYEGVNFTTAVKMLAERAGITLEFSEENRGDTGEKEILYKIHEDAALIYHKLLLKDPEAQAARDYLAGRQLTDDTINDFLLGYAPERRSIATLLKKDHYKKEQLEKAGLIAKSDRGGSNPYYDRFRKRLMIPIRDELGRVVAFTGRILEAAQKGAKYVNSPETRLFHKSRILFGFDKARRHIVDARLAIVCEGQIDVIRCTQAGINTAVASQGTAFTEDHTHILKRYTDAAVIAFDSDKAGQDAALKTGLIFLKAGLTTQIAQLADGEDPDTIIQQKGPEAFLSYIKNALPLLEFQFNVKSKRDDLSTEAGRMRVSRELMSTIVQAPSEIQRESMIKEAARLLNVRESSLRNDLRRQKKPYEPITDSGNQPSHQKKEYPREELDLLELVLAHGNIINLVSSYLTLESLQNDICRALLKYALNRPNSDNWNLMEELAGQDKECFRLAAQLQINPRKFNKDDITEEDAAKALILVITRKKLERLRSTLRKQSENGLTPDLERKRSELTHDINILRQGWDHAAPILEVYVDDEA